MANKRLIPKAQKGAKQTYTYQGITFTRDRNGQQWTGPGGYKYDFSTGKPIAVLPEAVAIHKKSLLQKIDDAVQTNRPTIFMHNNGSGYGGFNIGLNPKPYIVQDSPAKEAAGASVVGHVVSQALKKTPMAPLGNAVDIATTIPDAALDILHQTAYPSWKNWYSVQVDVPEIFPGYLDDVVAGAGFEDDLNQFTDGKSREAIKSTKKIKKGEK